MKPLFWFARATVALRIAVRESGEFLCPLRCAGIGGSQQSGRFRFTTAVNRGFKLKALA
jgi:hypothetical protein